MTLAAVPSECLRVRTCSVSKGHTLNMSMAQKAPERCARAQDS